MEDIFTFVVAVILLVMPFVDWSAYLILRQIQKEAPFNPALNERKNVARILAVSTTLTGLLALARITSTVLGFLFVFILAISLILTSVPNMYWLWLYFKNKLHD